MMIIIDGTILGLKRMGTFAIRSIGAEIL